MKTIENINGDNLSNEFITEDDKELLNLISIKKSSLDPADSKEFIRDRVFRRIESFEVNSKSSKMKYLSIWKAIAAAVVLALIISGGIFSFGKLYQKSDENIAVFQKSTEAPLGAISSLILPDGTEVTLNSGSSLKYPSAFNQNERIVELSGEAIFKVTKRPKQPFVVRTTHLNVRVLGTVFNLKAYPNEVKVQLTLSEGKVKAVSNFDNGSKEIFLIPNNQIELNTQNGELKVNEVNALRYFSWRDGEIYFQNNTLEEISMVLSRKFNTRISFTEESIKKELYFCQFTKNDKIERILALLSQESNWEFAINDKGILIKKRGISR